MRHCSKSRKCIGANGGAPIDEHGARGFRHCGIWRRSASCDAGKRAGCIGGDVDVTCFDEIDDHGKDRRVGRSAERESGFGTNGGIGIGGHRSKRRDRGGLQCVSAKHRGDGSTIVNVGGALCSSRERSDDASKARTTSRFEHGIAFGAGRNAKLTEKTACGLFVGVAFENAAERSKKREAIELFTTGELVEESGLRLFAARCTERDGRVKSNGRIGVGEKRNERVISGGLFGARSRRLTTGRGGWSERTECIDGGESKAFVFGVDEPDELGGRARCARATEKRRDLSAFTCAGAWIFERRREWLDRASIGPRGIEKRSRRPKCFFARGRRGVSDEFENDRNLVRGSSTTKRTKCSRWRKGTFAKCVDDGVGGCRGVKLTEHPSSARCDRWRNRPLEKRSELGDCSRPSSDERITNGRAFEMSRGVFLCPERLDERANSSRRSDASKRNERRLTHTGIPLESKRRDGINRIGRAQSTESRERFDFHFGNVVTKSEKQRLRRVCVTKIPERTNNRLPNIGHRVLNLTDERHDGPRIPKPRQRASNLSTNIGRPVIELPRKRRNSLRRSRRPKRIRPSRSHSGIRIPKRPSKRLHNLGVRHRVRNLTSRHAQPRLPLTQPKNRHLGRRRNAQPHRRLSRRQSNFNIGIGKRLEHERRSPSPTKPSQVASRQATRSRIRRIQPPLHPLRHIWPNQSRIRVATARKEQTRRGKQQSPKCFPHGLSTSNSRTPRDGSHLDRSARISHRECARV
jgi:hypothetical protein